MPENSTSAAAEAGKARSGYTNGFNTRSRTNGKASSNSTSATNGGLANGHASSGDGRLNGHANGHTNGHADAHANGHINDGSHQGENGRMQQQNGTTDSSRPTNGSQADSKPSKPQPKSDDRTGGRVTCQHRLRLYMHARMHVILPVSCQRHQRFALTQKLSALCHRVSDGRDGTTAAPGGAHGAGRPRAGAAQGALRWGALPAGQQSSPSGPCNMGIQQFLHATQHMPCPSHKVFYHGVCLLSQSSHLMFPSGCSDEWRVALFQAAHRVGKLQHAWETVWSHRLELQAVSFGTASDLQALCLLSSISHAGSMFK